MIGPLYRRLLRQHAILLGATCCGLLAFEVFLIWITAQIDTGPGLQTMLETFMPPAFRELLGSNISMLTFSSAVAFGFRHPLGLGAMIAFVVVAATVPAGERESGFLDLLLARPVARWRYLSAVCLLLVTAAVLLPLALLLGTLVGLALVDGPGELPWTRYAPSAFTLSALLLALGGYSVLIATGARRRGIAAAWAVGLTLLFLWIDLTAPLWPPLGAISWISPFHYFAPIPAAMNASPTLGGSWILLAGAAVTAGVAYRRFDGQDL